MSRTSSQQRAESSLGPLWAAIHDVQFRQGVAARMLTPVYIVCLAGLGVFCVATISDAFAESPWLGVFYLLVVGPAYFLVGAVLARVVLETIRAIIQIADDMHRIAETHDRVADLSPMKSLMSAIGQSGRGDEPRGRNSQPLVGALAGGDRVAGSGRGRRAGRTGPGAGQREFFAALRQRGG